MRGLTIGSGVVGSATGKGFQAGGMDVTFYDVNPNRVKELSSQGLQVWDGTSPIQPDIIFVCVGTPSIRGGLDLTYLRSATKTLGAVLRNAEQYITVVLRCTVPPGTTEKKFVPWLESASCKKAGEDFGVAYYPEFLREVSALEDALNPWLIVVGASTERSNQDLTNAIMAQHRERAVPMVCTDVATAELAKYASNLYNATKISFTNEIWMAGRDLKVDGDAVMSIVSKSAEGMWNAKYGTRGGFPYGGMCLPKDTEAFLSFSRMEGIRMPLLESVIAVNERVDKEAVLE